MTLEDEFGLVDVVIFENIYHKYFQVIYNNPLLLIRGEISKRDPQQLPSINAIHIQALG